MKALVIGSGGREHALVWKIAQSTLVERVYAVPGNAGMAECAIPVALPTVAPFDALLDFAETERVDLTVVGPETPLVDGIGDAFASRGLRVFGPNADAAQLEGSKAFAKERMTRFGIPTADYRLFTEPGLAKAHIREIGAPVVVKADGLAAGKGAVVCGTVEEAIQAVDEMMVERRFGDAGDRVLVEECLVGEEASFIAICDGRTALPMASSQDHKRAFDGDKGPNTGGMGAYSPAPVVDDTLAERLMNEMVLPLMDGMVSEGRPYKGFLYIGVMVTAQGPKALEFNCRLGDPEAQVLLPRMASDLVPALEASVDGTLDRVSLEWRPESCVCVVMASGGYPDDYRTGYSIQGLAAANARPDTVVFHAGTALDNGNIVTKGGRALGVTALGSDIRDAVGRTYEAVGDIAFRDAHFRRDIGYRALARLRS